MMIEIPAAPDPPACSAQFTGWRRGCHCTISFIFNSLPRGKAKHNLAGQQMSGHAIEGQVDEANTHPERNSYLAPLLLPDGVLFLQSGLDLY